VIGSSKRNSVGLAKLLNPASVTLASLMGGDLLGCPSDAASCRGGWAATPSLGSINGELYHHWGLSCLERFRPLAPTVPASRCPRGLRRPPRRPPTWPSPDGRPRRLPRRC